MTQPLLSPADRLRAALHAALRFIQHEFHPAHASDAHHAPGKRKPEPSLAPPGEALARDTRELLDAPLVSDAPAPVGETVHIQLNLLAERLAEQGREPAGVGSGAHDPVAFAALGAELETVRARVRQRRVRIGARVAAQRKSAHHVETRAQRLEQRLEKVRDRRIHLLEVDLGIARVDVALVASQVALEEAISQLTACERELNRCTTQCALLRERGSDPVPVGESARQCVERVRAKLKQVYEHGRATRTLDEIACDDAASGGITLLGVIDRWRAQTDLLADLLARSTAADPASAPTLRLVSPALRTQLDTRLQILVALGEIRVEETEALHASLAGDTSRSQAAFARLSGARIGLLLDDAQRAWLLDTLEAARHEQSAHLPPAEPDAASADALLRAGNAWRSCEQKLAEAAAQARSVSRDLAALRGALGPALASAEGELRQLGARIRDRQSKLRSRTRQSERAQSRLQLTRKRRCALEANLQRARTTLERAHARVEPPALAALLARLYAFEREVEAGVAALAGLHAAHDRSMHAMLGMERALIELSTEKRAPAALAVANALPGTSSERVEQDVAVLTKEIEQWKASHAQLEQRVEAQAGRLASLETGQHDDAALADLRLELEHARTCAAASLQRAIALNPESIEPEDASGLAPQD